MPATRWRRRSTSSIRCTISTCPAPRRPASPRSAAPRSVSSSPTIRPTRRRARAEAERLITQEKVVAILGSFHSSGLGHRVGDLRALRRALRRRRQFVAEPASQGAEVLLPPGGARRVLLDRDVRLPRRAEGGRRQGGERRPLLRGHDLRHRLVQRPAQARRRARLQDRRRREVSRQLALAHRRGAAAEERRRRRALAVELHHRRPPAGQDHGRARLQAEEHARPGRRLLGEGGVRRGRRQARGPRPRAPPSPSTSRPSASRSASSTSCTRRAPVATSTTTPRASSPPA